jgi:hypothetical protein
METIHYKSALAIIVDILAFLNPITVDFELSIEAMGGWLIINILWFISNRRVVWYLYKNTLAANNPVKVQSIAKLREELQYTITEKFTASKNLSKINLGLLSKFKLWLMLFVKASKSSKWARHFYTIYRFTRHKIHIKASAKINIIPIASDIYRRGAIHRRVCTARFANIANKTVIIKIIPGGNDIFTLWHIVKTELINAICRCGLRLIYRIQGVGLN